MKMADLPSRVLRPLGDWDDDDSHDDIPGLTPLRAKILRLCRRGVDTALGVSRAAGCSLQGALRALKALEQQRYVDRVEGPPNPKGGRPVSRWVAL